MRDQLKVIISGGGTGGHIFPALAIANALKHRKPDTEFLFIGAKGKMEMEKVPAAGYTIEGLWISGFNRSFTLKNLMFPFKLISSLIRAGNLISKFKPDVVIGVGGYSSGPVLYRASGYKIPTLIQEQNAFPGVTNKILGKRVNKICVAYENMNRFFQKEKLVLTGNPVRKEIANSKISREHACQTLGLDPSKKVVLAVGGSLGARSINTSLAASINKFTEKDIQLVWQTGTHGIEIAQDAIKDKQGIQVSTFIDDMATAYAAADVVISRAGAIALSELCIVGKAVVLVPYPYAAEDHQYKNAMALQDKGAAIVIRDKAAGEQLVSRVLKLIEDEEAMRIMKSSISAMAMTGAADLIVDEILELVK